MGWERKRGKLEELNRLLRGDRGTSYVVTVGDLTPLADVRYVLTIDSDTVLPRNVARQLVGIAAHPLQRPHYDPAEGRVTAGYTTGMGSKWHLSNNADGKYAGLAEAADPTRPPSRTCSRKVFADVDAFRPRSKDGC